VKKNKSTKNKKLEEPSTNQRFSEAMNSTMVFVARYAHNRNTSCIFPIMNALKENWHLLNQDTRNQIIKESEESEYHQNDWAELKTFASQFND
jgi:hypothetical protein